MKKSVLFGFFWLWAFCFIACNDEEIEKIEATEGEGNIELSIAMAGDFELDTRSALVSSEPMHHIEHLYAYLFAAPDGVDLSVDNATCVYEEELPWKASEEALSVFRCKLKAGAYQAIEQNNPSHKTDPRFLVMVVGVDNNKDTYTFPVKEAKDHLGMTGKKLSDVKFELAGDPQLMSYTELFAGYTRFSSKETLISVNIKRRVAGVLCYLKDIPAIVNNYHIIGVQLHCTGGLNRMAMLKPKADFSGFEDLTQDQKDPNNTLVVEANLKEMGAEADENNQLLYIPPIQEEGVLKTLPNTLLMGAYMLPIKEGAQFTIRLVGEERDSDGNVTGQPHVFTEKETDGFFVVKNNEAQSNYSLRPDFIYNIGLKPYATDVDYDDPMSLKGKPIVVTPKPWTSKDVLVDFSNVQMGISLSTGHASAFKYDCIAETYPLQVKALSADYENAAWTLTSSVDWLLFLNEKGEKVSVLKGVGDQAIQMCLSDYINANSEKVSVPDEDYRVALLTLNVDGAPLKTTATVRQWNALIVKTCDEKHNRIWKIAFRRLDNGASFNENGTMNVDAVSTYEWGYEYVFPTSIFDGGIGNDTGDDGLSNYESMKRESGMLINKQHWPKSVVNLAHKEDWFVPARIELHALLVQMGNVKSANLGEDVKRWSSTAVLGVNYWSYVSDRSIIGKANWWDEKSAYEAARDLKCRARLAHKIPESPAMLN